MDRKKILHLITSLNIGGTEKFLFNLVKYQSGKYDVVIGFLKEFGPVGVELRKLGISVYDFSGIKGFFRLIYFIRSFVPDLLHTHLYRANIFGRILSKFSKNNIVVFSSQQSMEFYKNKILTFVDAFSLKFTDCVIANSKFVKDLVVSREGFESDRVFVVHNGIDFKYYQNTDDIRSEFKFEKDDIVLGYIGRIHKDKGIIYLPDIIKISLEKNQRIKYLIVGRGPLEKYLKSKIAKYKCDKQVVFAGWRYDLPRVFNAIDLCIMPSLEESFPQVCLESLAAGRPIIANDVGGIKEVVKDKENGYLIKLGDINSFVDRIIELSYSQGKRLILGENGRKLAESFSIESMLQAIENIYGKYLVDK
ncbi:MAG: glycosyltransferase [bacterium]